MEEGSIQTTGYYMNPRYSWSNDTQTLIGYEATTTLTVSDLLIDSLGDILTPVSYTHLVRPKPIPFTRDGSGLFLFP